MGNNRNKYFPRKPWELNEKGKDYRPSAKAEGILSKLGTNDANKITMNILRAVVAILGVSYATEVFGEGFAEKLVAADSSGNITPIVNSDGKLIVGNPTSNVNINEALFTKNQYVGTAEGGNVTFRNNQTLLETESIPAPSALLIAKDVENGIIAVSKQNTQAPYPWEILLRASDSTEQTLTPNAKFIHALEFSNSKLYAAIQDKTDNKFYIKILALNGEKQYAEEVGSKINLTGKADNLEIHNGKIIALIANKLNIFNQETLQSETAPIAVGPVMFGGRPGENDVWTFNNVDGIQKVDLSTYQLKTVVPYSDITTLLNDDIDYDLGEGVFSPDGNRLYATSYTGQDKPVHYIVTIYLNQDGSVQKMEKSILTQGSPAPVPIDLSMDVDTDEKGGANKPDGITNAMDNCPDIPNNAQMDKNDNGIGDACENPDDYAASQGYDNYQEVPETGHNVFYNGDVDIINMGDKVIISPSAGQEVKIGIINNGESQSKPVFVNIPPKTDYVWASFEGFGDVEETEPVDFPEGETKEGSTEENGVVVAVSGTDIELTLKPTQITADEGIAEEDTNGEDVAEDAQIVEENKDVFEVSDEMSVPDEMSGEEMTTEDAAEAVEAAEDTAEEITEIVEKPDVSEEALEEVIAPDTHQETYIKPDSQPEKDNGGGGCDMNNKAAEGANTLTLTGAALLALAAMRKRITQLLKT